MAVDTGLDGWVPIRFFWRGDRPWVDWCQLGDRRLTEPFFDHAIENCLRDPYRLLFRRETPIDALAEITESAAEPNGFIFHMSRCGSTLLAQMLATLPSSNVVSEPSLIDSLFRYPASDEERIAWLQSVVMALGRPPRSEAEPFFLKLAPWHALQLPLIRRAFPAVPWIFLYRHPVEVLVSLGRNPGRLVPGAIDPVALGIDDTAAFQMPMEEYHARTLDHICRTAIENHRPGQSLFVNYSELPDVAWTVLPEFFRFPCSDADRRLMRERARFGGKNSSTRFRRDMDEKQKVATESQRSAAGCWLQPGFETMETITRERTASATTG